eukprot:COSAG06_NODE_4240_length_4440_cov_1.495969_4_plen_56_part_00
MKAETALADVEAQRDANSIHTVTEGKRFRMPAKIVVLLAQIALATVASPNHSINM